VHVEKSKLYSGGDVSLVAKVTYAIYGVDHSCGGFSMCEEEHHWPVFV